MTGIGSGSRGGLVGGGLGSGLSLEGRLGGFVVLTSSLEWAQVCLVVDMWEVKL